MKKLSLILFVLLVSAITMVAQKTVTGKVADSNGEPLIGANVLVQGTDVGTVTDIDGMFSLSVPQGKNTIVISYIGFTDQVLDVTGQSDFMVTLQEGQLLDEVVISALGVERNARNVVYANQTVGSEDLNKNPNKNALEALRGKAAGVRITTGSGSVGASSRIILRAEASLTGNNNALIVIDGIPVDNNSVVGGGGTGEGGFSDYGNRFNDLNPEDIETVTILKGPSATSLYGSRGASGVLLVTTKKGKKGKTNVSFKTSNSIEQAYILMQRQDQFGQGLINPDGTTTLDSGENFAWGPRFDGIVRPWTSPVDADGDGTKEFLSRPYSAVPDQLENFFRNGSTSSNTVSLSGGNDAFTYFASYGNTLQKGILDNTDYTRHNLTLNASAKLSKRVSSSFGVTYANIDQNTALEGARSFEGANSYASALQSPTNIPFNELRDYKSPFHSFEGFYGSYTINPYFILNEYTNNGKINNLLGNFALNFDLGKGFSWNNKAGTNVVGTNIEEAVPVYDYLPHDVWLDNLAFEAQRNRNNANAGSYKRENRTNRNIDLTSTLNYTKTFGANGKYALNAAAGYNMFDRRITATFAETQGGLVVPGVYNLANSVQQARSTQGDSKYRIMGFFGNASIGLNNNLFLEYSARQDYSSTLPEANQSFFYQAIGASAVLSELFKMESDKVNFIKVRASYGTTGKDAGLYLLQSGFLGNPLIADYNDIYDITLPLNGQTGFSKGNQIGNPDLKPELTTTFEAGLDIGFLKDRINLEYTYFNSNHSNQIVVVSLSDASGYGNTPKNVGKIINKGHEIGLRLKPLTNRNGLHWDLNLTYTKYTNVVDKISDETDELVIWDSGRGVTLVAEKGQPFGTFKGLAPRFDPSGNPIVSGGTPVYETNTSSLGSIQADWLGSISTEIGYKNLSLNALLDTRQGSSIFSLTKFYTEFNGTASTTTINDRKPFIVENSVVEVVGADGSVTYEPNTVPTLANAYLDDGNWGRQVLDGSFVKLREIGLSYDLPKSVSKSIKASGITLGLFIRNPKIWVADENTFADPEVNGPGSVQSNVTGIETTQTPTQRSFGFNLNVNF